MRMRMAAITVLVVGGEGQGNSYQCHSSAELYNSSTGSFTYTGSMTTALCFPTATLLNNGKVLVIENAVAEIYDPSTGTFSVTGSLNVARVSHTATLLGDGKVLVAGGEGGPTDYLASAELYDPTTGTFTLTGRMHTARALHSATLLGDGEVLIAGGQTYIGPGYETLSSAELYNPSTGTFTITGSMNQFRMSQAAVLLPSGEVLQISGYATTTAELYNPSKGTFSFTGSLTDERDAGQGTVLLNDGVVLVTGGDKNNNGKPRLWNTAEIYP
jgi:hypothetical protein